MLIVGAGGAIVNGTSAYFSDTETSTGNVFTAGDLDLMIANQSYYNGETNPNTSWAMSNLIDQKFFDFDDLKPGDWGEDTITLHVDTNDAYMCANVTLTSNEENGINEPEGADGDITDGPGEGELANLVHFIWWADDGDNVLEDDETVISQGPIGALPLWATTTVALADSDENIWGGSGPIDGDTDYHIGKAWCFGTMTLAPVAQDDNSPTDNPGFICDGSQLDNQSQTDSLTADISFDAVQARNNPNFQCEVPEEVRECELTEEFANSFHNVDQGRNKNGTSVLANRSDGSFALGEPQSLGTPYDNPVVASSFFSLGFKATPSNATATTTPGGSIVLGFPGTIVNGPGPDIKLWEVTGGSNYPDELVRVEVGDSPAGPWTEVAASVTRDAEFDLGAVESANYVRITDISPPGPFEATADGFDLDAVQALNCVIPVDNGDPQNQ